MRTISQQWLEVFGADLDSGVLVDEFNGENEAKVVVLADENALKAAHGAVADADFLSDNQFAVGLDLVQAKVGAEEFDGAIRDCKGPAAVADDAQNAGRTEHRRPLVSGDPHKQIRGEERQGKMDALAVFPDANRLIRGKKRFDIALGEMPDGGLFVLGNGEDGVPVFTGAEVVLFPAAGCSRERERNETGKEASTMRILLWTAA